MSDCPPWQDISTLCANICACENTVSAWVKEGLLPPPRLIKGKRLWKWSLVEAYLEGRNDDNEEPDDLIERVKRAAQNEAHQGRNVRGRHS